MTDDLEPVRAAIRYIQFAGGGKEPHPQELLLSKLEEFLVKAEAKSGEYHKLKNAAKDVTLAAWVDRFGRLHDHPTVISLSSILEEIDT